MALKSSNKIRIEGGMSSMTDLVFLLLIFFIMVASMVNESHKITLPEGTGDPSEHSPVKVYLNKENRFLLNSESTEYTSENIEEMINSSLRGNKSIELLADKEADRKYAYQIIKYAKANQLKVIIKTMKTKKAVGNIINIGCGKAIILKKVIKMIIKFSKGGKPLYGKIKLRTDEPKKVYPSIKKAKILLNWSTNVDIVNGIKIFQPKIII